MLNIVRKNLLLVCLLGCFFSNSNSFDSAKKIIQDIPWQKIAPLGKKFLGSVAIQTMSNIVIQCSVNKDFSKSNIIDVTKWCLNHFLYTNLLFSLNQTFIPYKNIQNSLLKNSIATPLLLLSNHLRCKSADAPADNYCHCACKNPKAWKCLWNNMFDKKIENNTANNLKTETKNTFSCANCTKNSREALKSNHINIKKRFLKEIPFFFAFGLINEFLFTLSKL